MKNCVIKKFTEELSAARRPFLTTETQIVCGRVVLTALPHINSEVIQTLTLEIPTDVKPEESPFWLLFLVSVFDAETFCRIRPSMRAALHENGEYVSVIEGWRLQVFTEDGFRKMIAEIAK